jgi:amino acid adenylation domain-containing protein
MDKEEKNQHFDLTPMQQSMVLRSLVAPHEGHYIQQLVCRMTEAVELDPFVRAWELLAARHDMLRAYFSTDAGGELREFFAATVVPPVQVRDLTREAPDHRGGLLEEFLTEDRARGVDLDRPPLWRLTIFRWSATAVDFVWTFHHGLLDGRAHSLLLEELCQIYAALLTGRVPELPPARPFAEYLEWLAAQPVGAAQGYWRAALHHFVDAPALPSLAVAAEEGADVPGQATQKIVLDAEAKARLQAGAGRHGVTLNNLVQGAWALALGRYNAVEDVTFGTTRAGRHWPGTDADKRVGLFINTVPFRVNIAPDQQVGAWLRGLRAQQVAVRAGELASPAQIRHWAELPGQARLFRTVLVFETFELNARLTQRPCAAWAPSTVELLEKTDLLTLAAYADRQLTLALECAPQRHAAGQVAHVLEQLRTLLEALAAAPAELPLGRVNMLPAAERTLALERWQGGSLDYPAEPVQRLLEAQARRTPDAPALECEGQTVSYASLNRRANQLARRLLSWTQPGARVCVILDRSPEQMVAWLALLKGGLVYAPVDAVNPRARLEFYLQDLQPDVVLTQQALASDLPTGNLRVVCLDDAAERAALAALDATDLPGAPRPDDPANILFTSGSTGQPKGAINLHRGLSNLSATLRAKFDVQPGDRVLQLSATSFDASLFEMLLALQSGATLVLAPWEKLRPGPGLTSFLEQHQITVIMPTPTGLRSTPVPVAPALRLVLCCGEACPAELVTLWGPGRRFVNIYGPTECSIWATCDECRTDAYRPTIGRLVENYRGYVLDAQGQPLPVGVPGELFLGGPGTGLGYLNRPELSAERFLPDPFAGVEGARMYRTGDLVRWLEDGRLDCLRRLDFQVKFQGVRIELGEIEAALLRHPAVREAVVLLHEDKLCAWLVARGAAPTGEALREFLADHIQRFLIPGVFTFLPEMPRTSSGKIDRPALRATPKAAAAEPAEEAAARAATPEEAQLVLTEWNRTDMQFPREKSVVDFFREQARRQPDAPAACSPTRSLTYGELDRQSNRVAQRLLREGLRPEATVALLFERSCAYIVAVLGVLKAGGAFVPLDPAAPDERLSFLLNDCGARCCLAQPCHAARLGSWPGLVLQLDDAASVFAAESAAEPGVPADPQRRAYIIYTSGSTGQPKGVEIEHHSLTNLVCFYHQRLQLTARDRGTMVASVTFDASVADLWPCLCAGGTVLILASDVLTDPEAFLLWLAAEGVTFTFVPTALAELMLARPWPATPALRYLLTGGDTLHIRPRPELPFAVLNTYGPTENTVDSTWSTVTAAGAGRPSIGRGIGNVRVYVLSAERQPVPPGVSGELYLGGEQVARGYLRRPELTAERFVPDPFAGTPGARMYRTGDWARWQTDGELEFLGRLDDQVQIRGARVELGEIEAALRTHPGVREACCRPLIENEIVQGVIAYVVPALESADLRTDLRAYLLARLPCHMVPQNFTLVPALPRNAAGKVDRKALPPPDPAGHVRIVNAVLPRNELEQRLATLFEEVLGVRGVGVEDNFFELGGHSLLALRLLNRISGTFQQKLNIAALFHAPTIAKLAERLKPRSTAPTLPASVVVLQGAGALRPIFCVTGAGGGAHWFQGVSRQLGPNQPFYALETLGLSGAAPAGVTIESMAEEFLPALRQMQPHGPYLLGGFSVGGHIALELAQRLRAAGETVALLFLVDAYGPSLHLSFARRVLTYLANFWRRSPGEKVQFFREKIAWLRFRRQLRRGHRDTRAQQETIDQAMKSQVAAAWNYLPKIWPGRILLFRSAKPPNSIVTDQWAGWREFAGAGLDVHVIPGDHFALFRPPHDAEIASVLRAHLAALGQPPAGTSQNPS